MKSILLAVLMISMSLSVGLVELNKAPWLVEDAESELGEADTPMQTSAPSITYSSSTLALSNNTAMTPVTATNSGGTVGVPVAIDLSSIGEWLDVALDSDGYRHVSAADTSNNDLMYATDTSGAWVNITVDAPGQVGQYNSIAVDSGDGLHIAYYSNKDAVSADTKDLKYATCASSCSSASSWSNITIDATGSVGMSTSIAVDLNDGVHISYTDSTNEALKYTMCSSSCGSASSWSKVSVDNIGTGADKATDIAIDSNDEVHIAYHWQVSGTNQNVRYATCATSCASASSWTNTSGISLSNIHDVALAIDSNDALHIAGFDSNNKDIIYLACTSSCTSTSSWSNISAVTTGDVGARLSIAVDSTNNPHISYQNGVWVSGSGLPLGYATCTSSCLNATSFWTHGTVHSGSAVYTYGTSIAVNHNNDSVHIVHGSLVSMSSAEVNYLGSDTAPYTVSPDLPIGLNLDWSSGKISGTPRELSTSTIYTITARNAHGSDTTTLTISVNAPPLMTYDWGSGSSNFLSSEYVNNKVSVGRNHGCAILNNGSVMCWGMDNKGQLGNGATTTSNQAEPVYVNLPTGQKGVSIVGGKEHTCVLLDSGSVMCWGGDGQGQLGNGATTTTDQDEPVLVDLPTGRTAVEISGSWDHTCAILDDGSLMCWGYGGTGRLGNGDDANVFSPVYVNLPYGRTAVAVSPGRLQTCAILDDGSLMCWGSDAYGMLGNGATTTANQNEPVYVDLPTGRTAASVGAGKEHTCAILDNRSLICWGHDTNEQLGNGFGTSSQISPAYVDLPPGLGAVVSAVGGYHTCAILDNESTYCWGADNVGQLGIGATTTSDQGSPVYVNLPAGRTAVAMSAGEYTTCAILDNSSTYCWGRGTGGQLGDGGNSNGDSPVSVSGNHAWDNTTNLVSSTLRLLQNVPMSSLSPIFDAGFGAPTSCGHTPSLPPGLFLSNTCVLSGTPNTLGSTTLTITPTNAKGDGLSVSLIVNVNASGGSLIINTTSTEVNAGSAISDITMSYTHTHTVDDWVSGVTNSTINPAPSIPAGGGSKLSIDSGLNGDIAAVYSVERTGATSANLSLLYKWNGAWTESTIDSSVDTDVASVAIDRQGVLHIGYVDKDNAKLKYATNASGSWVIETLGDAATHQFAQTAISVHPVTNAVHIMAVNGSTISTAGLNHHTNETGTWLNSTISDPSEEEGFGVNFDIDSDGNLHVVFRREANSVTTPHYDHLIMASRINGVWQNQTIATNLINGAYGHNFDMAIDSQDQIHVTFHGKMNVGKYIWHGVLSSVNPSSSWVLTQLSTSGFWPALAVDSNDNVHLSYHGGSNTKDQWYQTYTSGTWSSRIETSATAGNIHGAYYNEMTTDSNDDVFIFAYGEVVSTCKSCDIRITRIQGLGPSLATNPIFEVSPELPDGLIMNWRNGTISGTPTEGHANTTHTVTVTAFGATTTETFTLMVLEAPDISYAGSPFTFTKNTEVVGETPTNNGGAVSTWAIHPAASTLPSGLFFGPSNGTIYGTPTAVTSTATFTVWANNSADSNSTTISFTVQDEAPDISYAGSPFLWTKGTFVITAAINTGGGHGSSTYSVTSGTLPAGISLGSGTGYLLGTPTAVYATALVTITATNSAGSNSTTISITVQDEAPDISYAGSPFTFTKNTEVVGETPINDGGAVSTWAIHPAASTLPSGLLFGPSNGTIYGTPTTVVSSAVTFTVWANNSADSNSTTISITVQDEAADISYAGSPFTFTKNDPVSGESPTNVGGAVSTWEIDPDIASSIPGLSFNPANGVITGTPTGIHSAITFTVWANNSADDISTTISITVQDEAPSSISYPGLPYTFTKNSIVNAAAPTYTDGAPTSWSIDSYDNLPAGIEFDNATGEITGTPTAVTATVTFTVWGNNSAGDISTTIQMTVNDIAPAFTYTSLEVELTNNSVTTLSPISTGGIITSWEFVGTEPNGLNFGPGNGTIWGTPTDVQSKTQYLIWGNNSGGEHLVYMNITISDVPVVFSYASVDYNLTRAEPMATPINPASNGIVETWEIEPLLTGTGLSFDSATGEISGTPIINMTRTQYTVWANNTGGNVSQSFNITINEPRVDLDYSRENEIFVTGTTISPLHPTVTGGMVETWEYEGILPNGLFFTNGVFTGTPTDVTSQTMLTVWANNTGGAINHTLNFTVNAPGVELDYIPDYAIITIGQPMTALTPIVTNATLADVDTWSIYPELDNGLSFGTNNGTIWGTPTSIQPIQLYKIWANNTGGKSYHDINITILDIVPEISYSLVNIEMTNDTVSSHLPLNPTNLGGPAVTWSITPELSSGLMFDTLTGIISGTPDEVKASEIYTVSATNTGGTDTTQIEITVLDQVPMIAYVSLDEVLLNNSSVLNMVPESTGGAITQWSITPEPSPGLFFDSATGILSGTATEIKVRTEYEITATNDVGSTSVKVNVTVEDFDYDLSIGPIYLLVDEEMLSVGPTSTLSDSVYEISPDLPDGMFIGASNGTIWGTPTDDIPLMNFTIYANNSLFNEVMVIQIGVLDDSDSDGMPNQLPLDYNPVGGLVEDLDDDADGFSDAEEVNCATDPLDANSLITDLDGDSICDELDEDIDGDGLLNDVETNSSTYVDQNNTGTDSINADSDGDGVCDGPEVPANGGCSVGPDAFPFDSAGSIDSDGDGMPDTLTGQSTSTPPLVEDLDDDNDTWLDAMEGDCGTDSSDQNSVPSDEDGDGICDTLDTILDLPFTMTYPSDTLTLTVGKEIAVQLPTVSGLGDVATWEISSELPTGLIFGWSPARDAHLDGSITGTPTEAMNATQFTIWANNSAHSQSFNITISVLEEVIDSEDDDEGDSQFKWGYICFPIIILLLLLIFVLFFPSDKEVIDDAEPENTTSKPKFAEGEGTKDNPFVLKPAKDVNPGDTIYSEELITIANITPGLKIQSIDYLDQQGGHKFTMADLTYGNEEVRMFEADEEGVIKFQLIFDDSLEPTLDGGEFQGAIKIGRNSVYLIWDVKVKPDPEYVKQQVNLESESNKVIAAEEAEAKAKAKAKAKAEAKAEAKAKVKAKADAETEKLRAKKLEELERVKSRAKTIDFATLGVATIDEQDDLQEIKGIGPFIAEKLNALGIYTFAQVGNMTSKIEEEVNKAIEFFPGRVKRDQWAKQARELHENKK